MVNDRPKHRELYQWLKIAGLISYIPFILCTGPLVGYFLGEYLARRFDLTFPAAILFAIIAFIASVKETLRIIRLVTKTEKTV